jgi:T4 RnlA family RNA ligase
MFYLPSFEECKKITEQSEAFIHKVIEFEGYKFHLFNYLLAQYSDFNKPIKGDDKISAFELRGLTFLENEGKYYRSLMLHKFFNINQCEGYQYEDLKDLKVRSIQDKRDGSMIRFLRLPDGRIVAKTKMDFSNEQTTLANKLINTDKKLYDFVSETLDKGLSAIFELTSSLNMIVIRYSETKLTLIQLRDESNGEYLDLKDNDIIKKHNPSVVDECPFYEHLDYYLEKKEVLKGIEGWVFTVVDKENHTLMYKVKTADYVAKHSLMTDTFGRENKLLSIIFEEKIDDVLGELDKDDERKDILIDIGDKVSSFVNNKVLDMYNFLKENYKGDRKSFAMNFSQHEYFSCTVKVCHLEDEGSIKEGIYNHYLIFLKRKTGKLENARSFMNDELNINIMDYFVIEDDS